MRGNVRGRALHEQVGPTIVFDGYGKPEDVIVLALAILTICGVVAVRTLPFANPQPRVITSGTAAVGGPFTLIGTDGRTVTDKTYHGKWVLIFFDYAFRPDACPTALNNISVALETLGSDAVDPQRDTREVMAEYLKSFDHSIVSLTGSPAETVKGFRVYVAQQKTDANENYLVSHSAYIYLMNPQGKFVNVISGNAAGEEIAAWLRKEMARPNG
jgi:protein SCO1